MRRWASAAEGQLDKARLLLRRRTDRAALGRAHPTEEVNVRLAYERVVVDADAQQSAPHAGWVERARLLLLLLGLCREHALALQLSARRLERLAYARNGGGSRRANPQRGEARL